MLNSDHWSLLLGDEAGYPTTSLGDTVGSGEFGRGVSPGGVTDRGYYAFETGGGNRALGVQIGPTGFAAAVPSLRVKNETGVLVDHLHVSYEIWVNNDSGNSNYFDLEFSDDSTYIDPLFFDTPAAADAVSTWTKTELEYDLMLPVTVIGLGTIEALENGDSLWVEWSIGGSLDALNGYDEVALDNVRITAFSTAIPEPQTCIALSFMGAIVVARRRRRSV